MKNINNKKFILKLSFISIFFINNHAISESFFDEAKQKFDQKKYDDSKFLFQRNIVYNPKNAESDLYLFEKTGRRNINRIKSNFTEQEIRLLKSFENHHAGPLKQSGW